MDPAPGNWQVQVSEPDYQTLIQRTLRGDTAAFDELVRSCQADAAHVARRYLGASADVEDVIQDAFSQAFEQLPSLAAPDRFREWLRAIVRNRCVSLLRGRRREVSYEEISHQGEVQITQTTVTPSFEEDLSRQELDRALHTALDRLSQDQRSVTTLHYFLGKSYHQIARHLQVSVAAIEGRLYRARQQLKEELLKMADLDHEALQRTIEAATKGLHEEIEGMKRQLQAVQREEDRWIVEARSAAARTITQLPTGAENPITWSIVGGVPHRRRQGQQPHRHMVEILNRRIPRSRL